MIKIFLVPMLMFFHLSNAQLKRELVDGVLTYQDVVALDSIVPASKLYSRGLLFCADKFTSANSAVQLKDETTNTIVAKGNFEMNWPTLIGQTNGFTDFTIMISFKDGKYRYKIDNLVWRQQMLVRLSQYSHNQTISLENGTKKDNKASRKILTNLDDKIQAILESLHKYMITSKSNW